LKFSYLGKNTLKMALSGTGFGKHLVNFPYRESAMNCVKTILRWQFFQRSPRITQCGEQHLIEAFISQFAVEAFNETVLLGLSA